MSVDDANAPLSADRGGLIEVVTVQTDGSVTHHQSLKPSLEGQRNPFVGLRPFESEDEPLFYGRREQTSELLKRLGTHRFVAVVGGSGSGKSSLVKAGLIPAIKKGFLVEERLHWFLIKMRPGVRPLETLLDELEKLGTAGGADQGYVSRSVPDSRETSPDDLSRIRDVYKQRPHQAVIEYLKSRTFPLEISPEDIGAYKTEESTVTATAVDMGANLLLFVDQFEELFRYTLSNTDQGLANEARRFVEVLLRLSAQQEVRIFVVTTMRSDFMGACEAFPGLTSSLNHAIYLVPRLTRPQLREAIERPILRTDGTIQPRLLDQLLNECVDQPQGSRGEIIDQLPLLQHALMRTWNLWRRDGGIGQIDIPHYERAGTILGALEHHLESEVWGELSDPDRLLTERLFRALTDTDSANRQVRRPTRLSELGALVGEPSGRILDVLAHFNRPDRAFVTWERHLDDPMMDISHESLIRKWNRLARWAATEARESLIYLRLVEAAALHAAEPKALWRDPLTQPQFALSLQLWEKREPSREWATRLRVPREAQNAGWSVNDCYDRAIQFLKRSRDAYYRRRWVRKLQLAGVIAAIVSLILLARTYENASNLRELAGLLPTLAERSAVLLDSDPVTSVLLAAEAVRRADAQPNSSVAKLARQSLKQALQGGGGEFLGTLASDQTSKAQMSSWLVGLVSGPNNSWYAVTRSGEVFAATRGDETFRADSDVLKAAFTVNEKKEPRRGAVVKLVSNGDQLAVAFENGTVVLGALRSDNRSVFAEVRSHGVPVSALAFSRDGRWLVIGSEDGSLQFWNVPSPQKMVEDHEAHGSAVSVINAFDGGVITGDAAGTLRTWSLVTNEPVKAPLAPSMRPVTALDVSHGGRWLVAGVLPDQKSPHESPLQLWNLPNANERWASAPIGTLRAPDHSFQGDSGLVTSVLVTPHDKWIVCVLENGRVLAYLVKRSDDGAILATLQTWAPIELLPAPNVKLRRQLHVSVDGRWLAVQSEVDVHLVDLTQLELNPLLGQDAALPIHQPIDSLGFSGNRWLVAVLRDGTFRRWDLGKLGTLTHPPVEKVSLVSFDAQGLVSVAATEKGQVLLADVPDLSNPPFDPKTIDRTPMSLAFSDHVITTLAVSENGRWVLAGESDGAATLWGIGKRPQRVVLPTHVVAAQFSKKGSTLWTSTLSGEVTRWALPDLFAHPEPEPTSWLETHVTSELLGTRDTRTIRPVLTTAGDRVIVTWSDGFVPGLLRVIDEKSLKPLLTNRPVSRGLTVSPNGRWLVNSVGKVEVWDLQASQTTFRPLTLQESGASPKMAFSPDGNWLVVGQQGGAVLKYSTEHWSAGEIASTMPVLLQGSSIQDEVATLVISPHNDWLMSSDKNGSVLILDLAKPKDPALRLPRFPADGTIVTAVFRVSDKSHTEDILVTSTDKAVVRQWNLGDLDTKGVLTQAESIAGRNFSCKEWQNYFFSVPYQRTFQKLKASPCEAESFLGSILRRLGFQSN